MIKIRISSLLSLLQTSCSTSSGSFGLVSTLSMGSGPIYVGELLVYLLVLLSKHIKSLLFRFILLLHALVRLLLFIFGLIHLLCKLWLCLVHVCKVGLTIARHLSGPIFIYSMVIKLLFDVDLVRRRATLFILLFIDVMAYRSAMHLHFNHRFDALLPANLPH